MGTVHPYRPSDTVAFEGDAADDIRAMSERLVRTEVLIREIGEGLPRIKLLRLCHSHELLRQQCLAISNAMKAIDENQVLIAQKIELGDDLQMTSTNDNGNIEAVFTCVRRGAVIYISKFWFYEVQSSYEECIAVLERGPRR